jgi:hypothetical protein
VILDRLQDYFRRLYSSFNIQKQDILENKSHHEIQKLREQIKTISERLGNESTKNLRQFTISSLSKINNKLRVIEQKLQRSRLLHMDTSTATALGQPQLAAPAVMAAKIAADKLADPATNALGKATGAYGMKKGMGKKTPKPKRSVKPKDDQSNFLGHLSSRHTAKFYKTDQKGQFIP